MRHYLCVSVPAAFLRLLITKIRPSFTFPPSDLPAESSVGLLLVIQVAVVVGVLVLLFDMQMIFNCVVGPSRELVNPLIKQGNIK